MNKNKNGKRNGNRKQKARNNNASMFALQRYSLVNNPVKKAINIQVPIFACNCSDGTLAYSFFGTTSSGSLSRSVDLITNLIASREYTDLVRAFQFVRLPGYRIRFVPTSTGSDGRIVDMPAFYLTPFVGNQATTVTTAAYSDIAMECMPSNMARPNERYYSLPPVAIGSSGYPIGGSQIYIQSTAFAANANLFLLLGYLNTAQWTTGSSFAKVGVVDIVADVEFSAPFTQ
jgi:hypothetical protein